MSGMEYMKTAVKLRNAAISQYNSGAEKNDAYERLALLLSAKREGGHSGITVSVSGLDIRKLLNTAAVRMQKKAKREYSKFLFGTVGMTMPEIFRRFGSRKWNSIPAGLEWNIDFYDEDLARMGRMGITKLGEITSVIPVGINISKAQKMSGRVFNLSGTDASGAYMDKDDYASLDKGWRPDKSPILLYYEEVVGRDEKPENVPSLSDAAYFAL